MNIADFFLHKHTHTHTHTHTQPLMYQRIKTHKTVVDQYSRELISRNVVTENEYKVHTENLVKILPHKFSPMDSAAYFGTFQSGLNTGVATFQGSRLEGVHYSYCTLQDERSKYDIICKKAFEDAALESIKHSNWIDSPWPGEARGCGWGCG